MVHIKKIKKKISNLFGSIRSFGSARRKGFTLLEVMVAMFIFSLMMAASTDFFVKFIKSKNQARDIQENLENVQYAMNLMAKSLRTSSIFSPQGPQTEIKTYDYSQAQCISYKYDAASKSLKTAFKGEAEGISDKATCEAMTFISSDYRDLVTGMVNGLKMEITPTSTSPSAIGKVTLFIETAQGGNTVKIQSTVSLRDYTEAGI